MTNIYQIKHLLHQAQHELLRPSQNSETGEDELPRAASGGNGGGIDSLLRASDEDKSLRSSQETH